MKRKIIKMIKLNCFDEIFLNINDIGHADGQSTTITFTNFYTSFFKSHSIIYASA